MSASRQGGDRRLELRLLGPLEAFLGGQAVPLGGAKPRTLLAVLALDLGRVVSVDRLVEALWPGETPESAPHAVQVYVSQLRKALGPVIATRSPGYLLELPPDCVDVHGFTRLADEGREALQAGSPESAEAALREALALWRGPGARRLPLRAVRANRDRAARGAAHRRPRGTRGRRPRARPPRRARVGARGARPVAAAPRAPARPAHARALPLGPAGGRARCISRRTRDARRGARHRPRARAQGARGRDPAPGRVAPARGGAARKTVDAVPAARHDPLLRRRRVDGARGEARRRGSRTGSSSATSRRSRPR